MREIWREKSLSVGDFNLPCGRLIITSCRRYDRFEGAAGGLTGTETDNTKTILLEKNIWKLSYFCLFVSYQKEHMIDFYKESNIPQNSVTYTASGLDQSLVLF